MAASGAGETLLRDAEGGQPAGEDAGLDWDFPSFPQGENHLGFQDFWAMAQEPLLGSKKVFFRAGGTRNAGCTKQAYRASRASFRAAQGMSPPSQVLRSRAWCTRRACPAQLEQRASRLEPRDGPVSSQLCKHTPDPPT